MSPTDMSTFALSPQIAPLIASVGSEKILSILRTPRNRFDPITDPVILRWDVFDSTTVKELPLLRFTKRYGYNSSFKLKNCCIGLSF